MTTTGGRSRGMALGGGITVGGRERRREEVLRRDEMRRRERISSDGRRQTLDRRREEHQLGLGGASPRQGEERRRKMYLGRGWLGEGIASWEEKKPLRAVGVRGKGTGAAGNRSRAPARPWGRWLARVWNSFIPYPGYPIDLLYIYDCIVDVFIFMKNYLSACN